MLRLQKSSLAALLLTMHNDAVDIRGEREPVHVEFLNGDPGAGALFRFLHNLCEQELRKCMRMHNQDACDHKQKQ